MEKVKVSKKLTEYFQKWSVNREPFHFPEEKQPVIVFSGDASAVNPKSIYHSIWCPNTLTCLHMCTLLNNCLKSQ